MYVCLVIEAGFLDGGLFKERVSVFERDWITQADSMNRSFNKLLKVLNISGV